MLVLNTRMNAVGYIISSVVALFTPRGRLWQFFQRWFYERDFVRLQHALQWKFFGRLWRR
jgi:hypothetical protein